MTDDDHAARVARADRRIALARERRSREGDDTRAPMLILLDLDAVAAALGLSAASVEIVVPTGARTIDGIEGTGAWRREVRWIEAPTGTADDEGVAVQALMAARREGRHPVVVASSGAVRHAVARYGASALHPSALSAVVRTARVD